MGHAVYGIRKTVALGYDEAVETKGELQEQGFGVLSEIERRHRHPRYRRPSRTRSLFIASVAETILR